VNAEQTPKTGIAGADPPPVQGKATVIANRGMTQVSPRWSCRGSGDGTTQEETKATREAPIGDHAGQRDAREGQARPMGESERSVVPMKLVNASGGKGPSFKNECRK
jgi:hypothetical protein